MNIRYLEKIKCYLVNNSDKTYYFVNFDTNRIVRAKDGYGEFLDKITHDYLDFLHSENIALIKSSDLFPKGKYKPVSATFLMTTKCNLDCIYCYAYNSYEKDLSFSAARCVIDYLVENAIERGKEGITIRFHGLGEPTQNFSVLQASIEYAKDKCRKRNIKVCFHITTNGIMRDYQREFIVNNIDYITLSMDGLDRIQNEQRPLHSGDSFAEALKTYNAIKNKDKCLIRTTVTDLNITDLGRWCDFLQSSGIKQVSIEPVSICGNCINTNTTDLNNQVFCKEFIKLREEFPQLRIVYSCFQHSARPYHCGAFGSNMVLTPFDTISTCYECYDEKEGAQSLFVIGKVDNETVVIDENKIQLLRERCYELRKECSTCFAQSYCNGSCLSKRYKSYLEVGNSYCMVRNKCLITKRILLDKLNSKLNMSISCDHSETLFDY